MARWRNSVAIALAFLFLLPRIPSAQGESPLRFPLKLRPGMTRREVEAQLGGKPKKGTNEWPISGKIAYKYFQPAHVGIFFDQNESDLESWRKRADALLAKGYTIEQSDKMLPTGFPNDRVGLVNLNQEIETCDDLHAAFDSAVEFVKTMYGVRLTKRGINRMWRASNCLGLTQEEFAPRELNGYWVQIVVMDGNTPKDQELYPQGSDGPFTLSVQYTAGKLPNSSPSDVERTRENL